MPAPAFAHDDLLREAFWQAQFPKLSIHRYFASKQLNVGKPSAQLTADCQARMLEEGYFQQHDSELRRQVLGLAEAVKRCVALGLPPAFLFVFDEPWACFYRHHVLIAQLLGGGYLILPDFWVWHVDPKAQESGWTPHRDKGRMALAADGSPLSLTLWIPLSEATPLNGCIYLLPADRDKVYNTEGEKIWKAEMDLPSIRALPAKPGDYLCWNQAVLHWGARANKRAEGPRMSMALEFQRADIPPFNPPLIEPLADLAFPIRLKLVAKQILQYHHMYPLTPELKALAERILGA